MSPLRFLAGPGLFLWHLQCIALTGRRAPRCPDHLQEFRSTGGHNPAYHSGGVPRAHHSYPQVHPAFGIRHVAPFLAASSTDTAREQIAMEAMLQCRPDRFVGKEAHKQLQDGNPHATVGSSRVQERRQLDRLATNVALAVPCARAGMPYWRQLVERTKAAVGPFKCQLPIPVNRRRPSLLSLLSLRFPATTLLRKCHFCHLHLGAWRALNATKTKCSRSDMNRRAKVTDSWKQRAPQQPSTRGRWQKRILGNKGPQFPSSRPKR